MNARSAQVLAAALAFLLIVLVGALIFFLLSRPAQGPRATPSASPTAAVVSPGLSPTISPLPTASPIPTASLLPTFSPEPSPTVVVTPEITPEITPTIPPTPIAPPTATPAPTPVPVPISPARQIRFTSMGLDGRNPTGIERFVSFTVDGPSVISAQLSESTGRARVCLWQGTNVVDRQCENIGNGSLERAVFDAGSTSWHLTLISANQQTTPTVNLTLNFNANAPSVTLENFRFQGVPVANYNGYTAAVDSSGGGELRITGNFDTGQQHEYRVLIEEAGVGPVKDETAGPVTSFTVTHPVTSVTSYLVTVSNPNTQAEPATVFLSSTFSWP